jgi:adenine-specific DNA methylase
VLSRAMRAVCHRNGCSLLFTSIKHKEQLNKIVSFTHRDAEQRRTTIALHSSSSPCAVVSRSSAAVSATICWAWRRRSRPR